MSEMMLERVARAICGHLKVDPDGTFRRIGDDGNGYMSLPVWNEYAPLARAAVEAMRDADTAMLQAGTQAIDDQQESLDCGATVDRRAELGWRAMIDGALAEPAAPRGRE